MSNKPNEQEEKVVSPEKNAASFEENYIDENILADSSSKVKEFIKKFMKRKTAVAAFIIMVFLLIIAIIGPSLAPYDPGAFDYDNILSGPSAKHWFGTDQFGQDIFSRILAGAPLTLGVSLSSMMPWKHRATSSVMGIFRVPALVLVDSTISLMSEVLCSWWSMFKTLFSRSTSRSVSPQNSDMRRPVWKSMYTTS